jgi:hypothetical protein
MIPVFPLTKITIIYYILIYLKDSLNVMSHPFFAYYNVIKRKY